MSAIDVTFDMRSDTPSGGDPDAKSPTLRQYHLHLWAKRLPTGAFFELRPDRRYLLHDSSLGLFRLSSDTAVPTFEREKSISACVTHEELAVFSARRYTIGGMIAFPADQVNRQWTINQARGCDGRIKDRFDLTLECIRRHYCGASSPLSNALARYASFFQLFDDFRGYVEFFFLQDMLALDLSAVRFSLPFNDFEGPPLPATRSEYLSYMSASIAFIEARGQRMRRAAEEALALRRV